MPLRDVTASCGRAPLAPDVEPLFTPGMCIAVGQRTLVFESLS